MVGEGEMMDLVVKSGEVDPQQFVEPVVADIAYVLEEVLPRRNGDSIVAGDSYFGCHLLGHHVSF